jgi:hypothetical protein
MKVRPQEVRGALGNEGQTSANASTPGAHHHWFDSSLDLKRGLDVIELSGDELLRAVRESIRSGQKRKSR